MKVVGSPVLIDTFSTCPQSKDVRKEDYLQNVVDVARWSEQYGCKGILVYTDNSLADPWLVAQVIIQSTKKLCPLVAVQPVYMHPYSVAKMVTTYYYLYGRQICLNMVAGGFKNDLVALGDTASHDQRYSQLIEYTTIIKRLLASPAPVNFEGQFYKISNLRMTPPLPPDLFPGVFISGSSEAGIAAAQAVGATAVKYPKPAKEYEADCRDDGMGCGVRVGIIAREKEEVAWNTAYERFPEDRKGQLTHQLAMKTSDSTWHKQLSDLGEDGGKEKNPYWLVPFQNYKTFCPYLVGSYESVAQELARYITGGYQKFILDIPAAREDLRHCNIAFELASKIAAR
jgi:alkanesulfonate monooxygenase